MEAVERQICVELVYYGFEDELGDFEDPNITPQDSLNWMGLSRAVGLAVFLQRRDLVTIQVLTEFPAREDAALVVSGNSPEEDTAHSLNGGVLSTMVSAVSE